MSFLGAAAYVVVPRDVQWARLGRDAVAHAPDRQSCVLGIFLRGAATWVARRVWGWQMFYFSWASRSWGVFDSDSRNFCHSKNGIEGCCFFMGTDGGPAPPTWDRPRGRHSGACKMIYVAGLCCHEGPDITRQVRLVDHPRPPRFCGLSLFPACIEWQVGRGPHRSNKRSLSELIG